MMFHCCELYVIVFLPSFFSLGLHYFRVSEDMYILTRKPEGGDEKASIYYVRRGISRLFLPLTTTVDRVFVADFVLVSSSLTSVHHKRTRFASL